MEGYVIITRKEDLIALIKEVLDEVNVVKNEPKSHPKFLDIDKLVEFLGDNSSRISKSQIYKLTRLNKIPHRKMGKRLLFNKEEILEWLG